MMVEADGLEEFHKIRDRLMQHASVVDWPLLSAGKAGASQKTKEKVKSDKDAGLREGMLSLSSKVAASGKKAGGAAAGRNTNCHLPPLLHAKCQAIKVMHWQSIRSRMTWKKLLAEMQADCQCSSCRI